VPFGYDRERPVSSKSVRGQARSYTGHRQLQNDAVESVFRACFAAPQFMGGEAIKFKTTGKLATEYTVLLVTYGGDLASTRVANPEVHAEVR
jgi:hypothetical protein